MQGILALGRLGLGSEVVHRGVQHPVCHSRLHRSTAGSHTCRKLFQPSEPKAEIAYTEVLRRATAAQRLVQALQSQVQKETVPWLQELLYPLTAGAPEPLLDTVSPQQLADPDSSFVEVDGVMLHCKDFGPRNPDAPSVVLLHGFNASVFSWRLVMEAMTKAGEQGCRVVAVDRPPFGLSQRPLQWQDGAPDSNPYTNAGNARLVEGLIHKLGLRKPTIVGHSQGALVAMEVYRRMPEEVSSLIFVAPALPGNSSGGSFARKIGLGRQLQLLYNRAIMASEGPGLQYIRRSIRERADEVRKGGQLGVFSDNRVASQALIDGYLKPMRAHDWDKGSLYGFRAMSFPTYLRYEAVHVPVQIIHGENDRGLKTAAKQVYEIFRQRQGVKTEYVEIPACGHSPPDEFPDKFIDAIVPFLEGLRPQDAGRADMGAITEDTADAVLPAMQLAEEGPDAVPITADQNPVQRL